MRTRYGSQLRDVADVRAQHAVPTKKELISEGDADFVGDCEGVFHAGTDGRAAKIVAGEVQAGEVGTQFF